MLLQAIFLDASMTVSACRARLAQYGLWLDPHHPDVRAVLEARAQLSRARVPVPAGVDLPPDGVADLVTRLVRDPRHFGVAIRRQWYGRVLWYARSAVEVLQRIGNKPGHFSLLDALDLHEVDSGPTSDIDQGAPTIETVVMSGGTPVAVNLLDPALLDPAGPSVSAPRVRRTRGPSRGGVLETATQPQPSSAPPSTVTAWPRLDAPATVEPGVTFQVTVGFAAAQQPRVAGGPVTLTVPEGETSLTVTVELIANGFDAPGGWTRPLTIAVADITAASVTFDLVARTPTEADGFHLTTLEVRYVLGGAVCGTASCPIVVKPAGVAVDLQLNAPGVPWTQMPAHTSPVTLADDGLAPDLTIEFAKPEQNVVLGRYCCRLYSRHQLSVPRGPHDVDLGEDARTFARSLVTEVRQGAAKMMETNMRALGSLVAEKLPNAALAAIAEVAKKVHPEPPAILIVTADPYVPWELALLEPPLDENRPPYLGAQAIVGRWAWQKPDTSMPAGAAVRVERPPTIPVASIPVKHMAAMAGWYKPESGLRRLPAAEAEANALIQSHSAIPVAAEAGALDQLLRAQLYRNFEKVGAPGAVHFAGHGDFDKTEADGARLYLGDNTPISSYSFRGARYGGANQPILFLNACMSGIGGQLLGDMGGFPGNCLRGGFGAVLGALWEVNDEVASEIAEEFWRRVLPPASTPEHVAPEPVGAVLRDLRAKFGGGDEVGEVVPTYLAYVFYGHPRLVLQPAS